MSEHILVPLDGSSLAECVLPHVVTLHEALDGEVSLLRAAAGQCPRSPEKPIDPLDYRMRASEAEAYLHEVADRLQQAGVPTSQTVVAGSAADQILDFADDRDVTLIVLSSHGHGGLSGWNVGSVVQKVILRSFWPTMIVRAYQPPAGALDELRYERLLVPLDGSQRAECILPLATKLASSQGAELLLAHVVREPEVPRRSPLTEVETELIEQITERNREEGERYLADLKSRLPADTRTRLLVSHTVTATLQDLVQEQEPNLILVAAHGYSGESRWPYGSVALNFIAYGTTPLLIMQDMSKEERERSEAEMAAVESKGH